MSDGGMERVDEQIVCGGCGRYIEPPEDLPANARFLCSRCLFMLTLPSADMREGEGRRPPEARRPAVWNQTVAWTGLVLILAVGITPSVLFGYFTGHVYLGLSMAFSFAVPACVPAYLSLFRKIRNMQLGQSVFYALLGPWLVAWSFLPGVDTGQGRALLWFGGASTALGLAFLLVTLYSIRTLPRA